MRDTTTRMVNGRRVRQHPEYTDYWVSDDGNVYSAKFSGRWLKLNRSERFGMTQLDLYCNGRRARKLVAYLVLEAWVGPQPQGMIARHRTNSRFDDSLDNVYWGPPLAITGVERLQQEIDKLEQRLAKLRKRLLAEQGVANVD